MEGRPMGPARPSGGFFGVFKGIYNDEFQWSLVKSVTMFGVGVWIARECTGLDFMTPSPQL